MVVTIYAKQLSNTIVLPNNYHNYILQLTAHTNKTNRLKQSAQDNLESKTAMPHYILNQTLMIPSDYYCYTSILKLTVHN